MKRGAELAETLGPAEVVGGPGGARHVLHDHEAVRLVDVDQRRRQPDSRRGGV